MKNIIDNLLCLNDYSNNILKNSYCLKSSFDTKNNKYNVTLCKMKETKTNINYIPLCGIVSSDFDKVKSFVVNKITKIS